MTESKEVLVTDIKELTPGVRIKLINCGWCGNTHKFTCLNLREFGPIRFSNESTYNVPGVKVHPPASCDTTTTWVISQITINTKKVFRFIDFEPDSELEQINIKANELANKVATRKLLGIK